MTSENLSINIPTDAVNSLPAVQESIFKKYKLYIIGGSISAIVGVFLILWLVFGIFDKNSDNSSVGGPSRLGDAMLQLVQNSNNTSGITSPIQKVYQSGRIETIDGVIKSITTTIQWPSGSLLYKDSLGRRNDFLCPPILDLFNGEPVEIPNSILNIAKEYGPYNTNSDITMSTLNVRNDDTTIKLNQLFPRGSQFSFKVDNDFNISCEFRYKTKYFKDELINEPVR
jgi:hypothetical protein